MTKLLILRDSLRRAYANYETLLCPVWKFFMFLSIIIYINQVLGYDKHLKSIPVILLLSLVSAFIPAQVVLLLISALVLIHIYTAASLLALLALGIFLVLYLLFERFTPEYAYVVILMPFAMSLHLPLFPALLIGLVAEPAGIVAAVCGVIIYFLIRIIKEIVVNNTGEMTLEIMLTLWQSVMDSFIHNTEMYLYLAAIVVVIMLVYIIRRQAIEYSFYIAIVAGTVIFLMMLLIGELVLNINASVLPLLVGSLLAALLAAVTQFMLLPLDYTRVENVQFDDDDYYYYVKAVPKMQVAAPDRNIKRINAQKVTGNTASLKDLVQQVNDTIDEDSFEAEPSEIFDHTK